MEDSNDKNDRLRFLALKKISGYKALTSNSELNEWLD